MTSLKATIGRAVGCTLPLALTLGLAAGSDDVVRSKNVAKSGEGVRAKGAKHRVTASRTGRMKSAPSGGRQVVLSTAAIDGKGKPGKTDQDDDGGKTKDPPNHEQHPLRGWSLLHDGTFDPYTNSAYSTLGCDEVLNIGQGEDPQSFESGVIDIDGVLGRLSDRYPDGIQGYVSLDWEDPFFDILHGGPTKPKFEETMGNLVEFVRRFKRVFPESVVTHYNIPSLPFWGTAEDGRTAGWNDLSDECRAEYYERVEALRPVLDELDWFCPRYYDFIPSPELPDEWRDRHVAAELEHRAAIVRWLRNYVKTSDRPDRKIIPIGRTSWTGGASGYEEWVHKDIPVDEFIHEQLDPAMKNGADGLMLWEGYEMWMLGSLFRPPDQISDELREAALAFFRSMGVLDANEVPDWKSASLKREFSKALGNRQIRYVAAVASRMRSGALPPSTSPAVESDAEKAAEDAKAEERNRIRVKPRTRPMMMRLTERVNSRGSR